MDTPTSLPTTMPEISGQVSEPQEMLPPISKSSWENFAYNEQQIWLGKLGDRDCDFLEYSKLKPLQMKIGFALYSHPTHCSNTSLYENEKNQYVINICDKISDLTHEIHADGIYFSVLYVYCFIEESKILFMKREADMFQNVIFKIRKGRYSQEEYFIDSNLRVYNSWESFKRNNTYPNCWYALPKDGKYQADATGRVLLDIEESPACSLKSKLLSAVDIGGLVLGVGGIVGSFVFPPASPWLISSLVASGASGVFTGGRAIGKLTDRQKHKQSLRDKEAAFLWLELTLSVVTVGTSGFSIFKSVRAARAITTAGEAATATSAGEQVASIATETATSVSNGGQAVIKNSKSASKAASKLRNVAGKGAKALSKTASKGSKLARGGSRSASKFGNALGKGSSAKAAKNAAIKAIKNVDKPMKAAKKSRQVAKAIKKVADMTKEVVETVAPIPNATSLPNVLNAATSTVAEESSLLANFTQFFTELGLIQTPSVGVAVSAAATATFTTITTYALKILLQISIDYINSTITMKHKELLQEILTVITKIHSGTLEPLDISRFISFINFYFNTLVINHEHFIDNFLWNVYQTASKWLRGDSPESIVPVSENTQSTQGETSLVVWESTISSNGREIINNLITDLERAQIDWSAVDFSDI